MTSSTGPSNRPREAPGIAVLRLSPAPKRGSGAWDLPAPRGAPGESLGAVGHGNFFRGLIAGGRQRTGRFGFTVVEILLVILILGTLAGLSAPRLRGSYERMRLTEAANSLRNAMRIARELAITEGRRHRLVIQREQGVFWVERQSEDGLRYENARTKWGRPQVVPKGIEIVSAPPAVGFRPNGRAIELGPSGMDLHSQGSRPGGRVDSQAWISLANEMGDTRSVVLDMATGRVSVEVERT